MVGREQNKAIEFLYATPDHYMDIERAYIRSLMQEMIEGNKQTPVKNNTIAFKHRYRINRPSQSPSLSKKSRNLVMAIKKRMEDMLISDIRITAS
ncbi:MAG: hypothetical protein IPH18_18295 [Chitinophagaceae bacterium]|nr:hypothetical protein [Chitinophagaceae bacterium]